MVYQGFTPQIQSQDNSPRIVHAMFAKVDLVSSYRYRLGSPHVKLESIRVDLPYSLLYLYHIKPPGS